ncbi:ATP synthase regulation protein NCA2-domain-containing protein [Pilobolus umbonatus]|nr:ATP synthase regulation protein NCA2-domain-containing protein [Pilobolus umbonatus]
MATFVNEQVNYLDVSLESSFENLQKNRIAPVSQNKYNQVLLDAAQSLSLSSTSIPPLDKIEQCLKQYDEVEGDIDPSIEWLFIAKCTVAVYGQIFDSMLNMTLPVSQSIDYWNHSYRNSLREFYYAMQIAPQRVFSLMRSICEKVLQKKMEMSVFTSNEYILRNLFPIHQFKRSPFHTARLFSLSAYTKRPLLLEMVRDEIDSKRKHLIQFRYEQAAKLGILLQTPPQFQCEDSSFFAKQTATETIGCIGTMKYVLSSTSDITKNMKGLEEHMNTLSSLNDHHPEEIVKELRQLINSWYSVHPHLRSVHTLYGKPSTITRYWIPTLCSIFILKWGVNYGLKKRADIKKCIGELGKTLRDFIYNWVWEPVLKVWDTIRLKDERLSILSKEALQSDLNSLERMVTGFARDNLQLPEEEVALLGYKIREGDMSVVLKEYEREIKNPLKNAITGDLLQTMLIQVQKTKVDVDIAMSALDKLLKSNELNFAFLAVAPSMLLTWASASWLKDRVQGRSKHRMKKVGLPLRETLRRIERQLIVNGPDQHQEMGEWRNRTSNKGDNEFYKSNQHTECVVQGILLCEVHLLRAYASSLLSKNSSRDRFLEDVRDLENPNLTNNQKIQTIARMSRFWSFL